MRWVSLVVSLLLCCAAASVLALPPPAPTPPAYPGSCVETNGGVEACDGIDNDCDDAVDENLTRGTTCGFGVCAGNTGNETCALGDWVEDTCDPFLGAASSEACTNGQDDDCDGFTDADDPSCAPAQKDDGPSSSGSTSRSSNSFYIPWDTDDGEAEEDAADEPMVLVLNWTYEGSTATAVITEPTSPLKRLYGNVPEGPFLYNSSLVSADLDDLVAPLPENFSLYHRFRFGGAVEGVVFEDMELVFTVGQDWLAGRNATVDDLVVLYPYDGRWRIIAAEYNGGSRLYKASLINVPLRTLSIGVGAYEEEVSVQPDEEAVEEVVDEQAPEGPSRLPQAVGIIVAVLLGGLLIAFFLSPDVPVLGGLHDAVRRAFRRRPKAAPEPVLLPVQRPEPPKVVSTAPLKPYQEMDEKRKKYYELLARTDEFVKKQQARGVPDERIIASLHESGWKDDVIRRYFRF